MFKVLSETEMQKIDGGLAAVKELLKKQEEHDTVFLAMRDGRNR